MQAGKVLFWHQHADSLWRMGLDCLSSKIQLSRMCISSSLAVPSNKNHTYRVTLSAQLSHIATITTAAKLPFELLPVKWSVIQQRTHVYAVSLQRLLTRTMICLVAITDKSLKSDCSTTTYIDAYWLRHSVTLPWALLILLLGSFAAQKHWKALLECQHLVRE